MSTSRAILTDSTPTNRWDQAIYAFLAEKQRLQAPTASCMKSSAFRLQPHGAGLQRNVKTLFRNVTKYAG